VPTTTKPRLVSSPPTLVAILLTPDPFSTWTLTWDGAVSSTGVVAGFVDRDLFAFFALGSVVSCAIALNSSPACGTANSTSAPGSGG